MHLHIPTDTHRPLPCRCATTAHRTPQLYDPILDWVHGELGVRLDPTHSIFGAELGEEQLVGVERHLLVGG